MTKKIVIDYGKCLACRNCELACSVEHSVSKNAAKALGETPLPVSRITITARKGRSMPVLCMNCANPACVKACGKKALEKASDGTVIFRKELCDGCRLCVPACPFKAIKFDTGSNTIIKCDLCIERQKRGEPPACVEACPTKALKLDK